MINMNIDEIISQTVDQTILKLKMAGLMRDEQQTAFQKTEKILRDYNNLKKAYSEDGTAQQFVEIIDKALEEIRDDDYYELIPMIYFEGRTQEAVAEFFGVSLRTINRNKTRLINKLKVFIFADTVVREIFL